MLAQSNGAAPTSGNGTQLPRRMRRLVRSWRKLTRICNSSFVPRLCRHRHRLDEAPRRGFGRSMCRRTNRSTRARPARAARPFVGSSTLFLSYRRRIVALVSRHGLPASYVSRQYELRPESEHCRIRGNWGSREIAMPASSSSLEAPAVSDFSVWRRFFATMLAGPTRSAFTRQHTFVASWFESLTFT
jgi:hypothetical protein